MRRLPYPFCTFFRLTTSSPERGAGRKSNATVWRRFGGSTRSIFSSFLTRLCTWAACEARALKRSINFYLFRQHGLLALELGLLLLLVQRALRLVEFVIAGIGGE